MEQSTVRSGGRDIAVLAGGAAAGRGLVVHTGTPMPPVDWPELDAIARGRGLRVLLPTRPGYPGSTRRKGRSVADVTADTAAVLDAAGIGEFTVIGHSGGGPHALACAALLPDRCRAAISLAGVTPYEALGDRWTAGMADENVAEFGAAVEGESALRELLDGFAAEFATVSAAEVSESLAGLVTDVDRRSLNGGLAELMATSIRRGTADSVDGWVDDDLAFMRPWGFDTGSIPVPVGVWQGCQDNMVPFTHGEWLAANVGTARPRLLEDEGHLSLLTTRLADIVDDVVGLAGW